MEYRRLGGSGLRVSEAGLGGNNFGKYCDEAQTARVIHQALDLNGYDLIDRKIEAELLPFCRAHDVGIVPYSPLASGLLTGKYRAGEAPPPGSRGADKHPLLLRYFTERNFALVAALDDFARSHGHTTAELAIAWLLAHPEVPSVIAGSTKPEQVAANVAATAWKLTEAEIREIEGVLQSTAGEERG